MTQVKLTKEEISLLKEKFINQYCKTKGWNPKELSTNQMLRIIAQDGYKNPKIV